MKTENYSAISVEKALRRKETERILNEASKLRLVRYFGKALEILGYILFAAIGATILGWIALCIGFIRFVLQ